MRLVNKYIGSLLFGFAAFAACKHEKPVAPAPAGTGNYPAEIANIMVTRCATAGCHNAASYENAGGLLLDTWEHLFDGGNNGAVIIPYSIDYSSLLYFVNIDSSLGPKAVPTMPLHREPLSKAEYLTLRDWIANGAPDKDGNIPFASNAGTRQKVYMIHQLCDMVGVVDAEKNVVMRYIPIGKKAYPESATYIRMSPDGRYAYVCCWYSDEVYKIDTQTDKVVAAFNTGNNFWSLMAMSPGGDKIAVTNGDSYELNIINTTDGTTQVLGNTSFVNPHGVTANRAFDTFYVSSMEGNTIYKAGNGYQKEISIDGRPLTTAPGTNTPNPYEIAMSPDYSTYFVTCANTHEVRVFSTADDRLIKTIPVGKRPQSITFATSRPYVFITCMDEENTNARFKGAVYVINYQTLSVEKVISGRFYQPHSISVNNKENTFYVFSRNQNYDGPAPHHQGPCSGRNGYYEVYDMNTWERKINKRYEVLVDPYVSGIRFRD